MPVKHVENDFSAESSNPDLTALTASTSSSLAALQCYEDDCLDVELEPQELPQSINALAQENFLDFFELQDRDTPLDLLPRLERVKGILYHKFFENMGKNLVRQYVVPEHLREQLYIVSIIVNSEGILEWRQLRMNFARDFTFLCFQKAWSFM